MSHSLNNYFVLNLFYLNFGATFTQIASIMNIFIQSYHLYTSTNRFTFLIKIKKKQTTQTKIIFLNKKRYNRFKMQQKL